MCTSSSKSDAKRELIRGSDDVSVNTATLSIFMMIMFICNINSIVCIVNLFHFIANWYSIRVLFKKSRTERKFEDKLSSSFDCNIICKRWLLFISCSCTLDFGSICQHYWVSSLSCFISSFTQCIHHHFPCICIVASSIVTMVCFIISLIIIKSIIDFSARCRTRYYKSKCILFHHCPICVFQSELSKVYRRLAKIHHPDRVEEKVCDDIIIWWILYVSRQKPKPRSNFDK